MNTNINLLMPSNTAQQAGTAKHKTKSHAAQFPGMDSHIEKTAADNKTVIGENRPPIARYAAHDKPSEKFSQTFEKKKRALTESSDAQADQSDSNCQSQDPIVDILCQTALPEMVLAKPLEAQTQSDQAASMEIISDVTQTQNPNVTESVEPVTLENQALTQSQIIPEGLVQGVTEASANPENPATSQLSEKPVVDAITKTGDIENGQQLQQVIPNNVELPATTNITETEQPVTVENVSNEALPNSIGQQSAVKQPVSSDSSINLETQKQADDKQVTGQSDNQNSQQPDLMSDQNPNTFDLEQLSNVKPEVFVNQQITENTDQTATVGKTGSENKEAKGKNEPFDLSKVNNQPGQEEILSPTVTINKPQPHASAKAVENIKNIAANQARSKDVEPAIETISTNNSQNISEKPTPFGTTVKTFVQANTGTGAGQQIEQFIHSNYRTNNQQMVIRLDPPDLGRVIIKFSEHGSDITGLLQVDKSQTKDQIQQALPEMIQNLQNAGIGIKKIEVVLTNQQDYSAQDHSATTYQDGSQGSQHRNPESQGNSSGYDQWLKGSGGDYKPEVHQQQSYFSDNEINMLM